MTEHGSSARVARLWDTIETSIREDEKAIASRLAVVRRTLAKGRPASVSDKDVVPRVARYFPAETLDQVHGTKPPRSVADAADALLRTVAEAAVLRKAAGGARGSLDDFEKVAERAGGDAAETVELHLGLGFGRYGTGLDGYEGRRKFLGAEVDTAWADGEQYPYTASEMSERLAAAVIHWKLGFEMLSMPKTDTHPEMIEFARLDPVEPQVEQTPAPHRAYRPDVPMPEPELRAVSVGLEITPVVPRVDVRSGGRPEDSRVARQTVEGAHFARLLGDVERFFFTAEHDFELESLAAFHGGAGFGVEVRLRGELATLPASEVAPRLYEALRTAGVACIVRPGA